ncbi:hypothetical protein BU23DRAFT_203399 [Bimuria novae-zelandiae CBS 107.79]|uniref:WSC domain-containing protein n=1 Tax=Bimuria novae-zelandiae CBS 107.79 TaxID=1447943 RepID=A0A6A5V440_9PLEO|nr:hypothetical protein BU23DRAFT_203399 [Bimuria novae-zelandiae CBS 107.79]
MSTSSITAVPSLTTLLALSLLIATAMADWNYAYCSSQNTASDKSPYNYDFQSNGECHDHCRSLGGSAFFVLQDKNCWCSDYIPQDQSDLSVCSDTCPGFPSENCGKAGQYYIYVELNGNPSGTAGAAQPSSTQPAPAPPASSAVESSPDPSTVIKTVTSAEVVTVSLSPPSSSSKPLPSTTSTTSESSTSTKVPPSSTSEAPSAAPPAATQFRTITDNSGVRTLTVIQTPSSTAQSELTGKSTSNTGAIVGGVVGGLGALALIVGGVLFLLWRRRKQRQADEGGESGEPGVHRYASTMSKAGLLRTEKDPGFPPPIATSGFSSTKRHSRTLDQESISPISASDRRNSSFRVDQRLNPSTLFVFDNTSRGSVGSLDDSRDYHRTLNVRNPDMQ